MALTNFAALTNEQKTLWATDLWKAARNMSFITPFMGKGANALITHVTELKRDEKGARAVLTLLHDLEGDGVVGDNTLKGNEEEMKTSEQVIRIDQLRNANKLKGRMADQKSIVTFRENSRDVLAYWLADRLDQLAFLTLSGISYTYKNNGATRVGSAFPDLEFAADVSAPTSNRYVVWDAGNKDFTTNSSNASIVAADTPTYEMLVKLKALAKDKYIRGIKGPRGEETYHVFMTPQGLAKLKLDPDFKNAVNNAGVRGNNNPVFTGSVPLVDGLVIHEYRHVFNTAGAANGSKWGAGGAVDGQRVLFCGAQALGMADLGVPGWVENPDDYDNQKGIAIDKIAGFLKPKYKSLVDGTVEDFGVIACDTAL